MVGDTKASYATAADLVDPAPIGGMCPSINTDAAEDAAPDIEEGILQSIGVVPYFTTSTDEIATGSRRKKAGCKCECIDSVNGITGNNHRAKSPEACKESCGIGEKWGGAYDKYTCK